MRTTIGPRLRNPALLMAVLAIAQLSLTFFCARAHAQGFEIMGSSEGFIFGRTHAAISYDVQGVLPSRSGEAWYPALALTVFQPPQLRPEGIAYRNGLLYVTGDWAETQNQIAVFSVNSWGDLAFHHSIAEPISNPPPTAIPNGSWWGPEGITFNTGPTGIGAGASAIVSVDNQQQGVGNTLASIDPVSGNLSGVQVAPYPEDICYAPGAQRFYVVVRSPNEIQAFDANMSPLGISWALPSRTRGAAVVSQSFGRFITGDSTIVGEVILAVCSENTVALPPLPNRLVAYKLDGTQIGAVQDMSWVDSSLDNSSQGGTVPGPHTFQGIAVDEANNVLYIADDSARAVYTIKPFLQTTSTATGSIAARTWMARGVDAKSVLPSRSGEPWYAALAGSVNNPPRLAPEGMTFRNGQLYVSGDWNETQNQVAVFNAPASGALSFDHAIQIPIFPPPPNPNSANNVLWGPEGLTFNTGASGYGANASALITVEDAQFLMPGNTRALLDPVSGALSGLGVFSSVVGAASPDDIAYGPLTNRFYVIADPDVLQVWTAENPPTYANIQTALVTRSKGLAVISPAFSQYLLSDPTITQEHVLVVAKSLVQSTSAPHNRLAVYSTSGVLRAQQDLFWTRDAFPGAPLQEFEAIAVDEANRIIYIGDEKAHGIFVLTTLTPLGITTTSPLPTATSGISYSQAIAASGGATPYTFTLTAGALPAGLGLAANGTISGSPTACGVFNFSVQAQDSSVPPQVSPKAFSISVASGGLAGDLDGNGKVNGLDISGFISAVLGAGSGACGADMNADFIVNQTDVPLFVAALMTP